MDKPILSAFQFIDYKVNSINFKRNTEFTYEGSMEIQFKFDASLNLDIEQQSVCVTLDIIVCDPSLFDTSPFTLNVSISGYFNYEVEEEIEDYQKFEEQCKLFGITALFPYLRSIISEITRLSNLPTLVLPLINVYNYLENEKNKGED